jgi:hypothetical protein
MYIALPELQQEGLLVVVVQQILVITHGLVLQLAQVCATGV